MIGGVRQMDKEKEIYLKARSRVFEIYGLDPNDKRYNCHHICQRSDIGTLLPLDFEVNALSNLIPMKTHEHKQLHERIAFIDESFELKQKWGRKLKRRYTRQTFDNTF